MHNLKKLFAGVLALSLILGLMACGKEKTPAPPADGQEITETPSDSIGTLDLVGKTRLTLHYNGEGNVVTITDQNGITCHSTLAGTACAEAVSQILQGTEGSFAESFLLIKQSAGTLVPDENFLQGIVTAAKKVLGDLPIILSAATDQNSMCYFSVETAKAVLAAYLGNPQDTTYVASPDPVDGYYQITAIGSTTSENYTVGALYGTVELQTEPTDDYMEEAFNFDDSMTDPNEPDPTQDGTELPPDEPPAQG